jgi:CPA1 family monovalent cation:H+ antiporter
VYSPFDVAALLLGLSAVLAYLNCLVLKLPLTVGIFVGALAGTLLLRVLNAIDPGLALKAAINQLLVSVDFPSTLLNGFLAFLLFAGALQVSFSDMLERKWTILALATFGTILSTGIIAAALFALSKLLGLALSIPWCLVFGALISPTDPVCVLDVLKRVGITRHLQATIAGESLFNDGVGVVLFTLMLSLAVPGSAAHVSALHEGGLFLWQAGGGALLGAALGAGVVFLLRGVDDSPVELIVSLALASGAYALAGRIGVSGPVAVVLAGIFAGRQGIDFSVSEAAFNNLIVFWRLVEEVLNAMLFLLIGLQIAAIDYSWRNFAAMAAMIPIVLLARWLSVFSSAVPLHLRAERKLGPLLILTWGGLRGGLSVAMALSLPATMHKAPILTITYGIVVFSLIVQGLTLAPLARRLMLTRGGLS